MNSGHRQASDYDPVTRARGKRARLFEEDHASAGESWLPSSSVSYAGAPDAVDSDASADFSATDFALSQATESAQPTHSPTRKNGWLVKHGHSLTYAALFLFTLILYFRPAELYPSPLTANIAFIVGLLTLLVYSFSQLALEGTLTARPREVNVILLLCLTGLLSIPLAVDPGFAWKTWNDTFIKAVLVFIVMINVVRTVPRLRGLLFLAMAVSCVLSYGALSDYAQGRLTVEGYRVAGIIGGIFDNPNDLALHLVTMIPIAVGLMLGARSLPAKLFYGICALLMTAANVVTYSRTGFLGFVCVVMVLTWKFGRRKRFSVTVMGLILGALFLVLAPGDYRTRVASIINPASDASGSASQREGLLFESLGIAARHPVLGVGMGNYPFLSDRELVSHNAYTQVATEMGALAFLLYLTFIITPLRRLRRIEREIYERGGDFEKRVRSATRLHYCLAIGLQASLIGYLVSSFFASVAYQWYIYYLVGYAVCLRRIYETSVDTSAAISDSNKDATHTDGFYDMPEEMATLATPPHAVI